MGATRTKATTVVASRCKEGCWTGGPCAYKLKEGSGLTDAWKKHDELHNENREFQRQLMTAVQQ
eukprot:2207274-Ditylum_brightwellii.AAC.1